MYHDIVIRMPDGLDSYVIPIPAASSPFIGDYCNAIDRAINAWGAQRYQEGHKRGYDKGLDDAKPVTIDQAKAQALRDAAADWDKNQPVLGPSGVSVWLRERADRLENPDVR